MALNNLDTAKRFYELVNSDPTQLPEVLDANIKWEIVKGVSLRRKIQRTQLGI